MTPLEVKNEGEKILSVEDAENLTPYSASKLYRVARKGKKVPAQPFYKQEGRWCTTMSDLVAWIRAGKQGAGTESSSDPIPPVRAAAQTDTIRSRVVQLRSRERAA